MQQMTEIWIRIIGLEPLLIGRGSLSAFVKVCCVFSAADEFVIPNYFTFASFVSSDNALTSNTFSQNKNVLNNLDGVNLIQPSLFSVGI